MAPLLGISEFLCLKATNYCNQHDNDGAMVVLVKESSAFLDFRGDESSNLRPAQDDRTGEVVEHAQVIKSGTARISVVTDLSIACLDVFRRRLGGCSVSHLRNIAILRGGAGPSCLESPLPASSSCNMPCHAPGCRGRCQKSRDSSPVSSSDAVNRTSIVLEKLGEETEGVDAGEVHQVFESGISVMLRWTPPMAGTTSSFERSALSPAVPLFLFPCSLPLRFSSCQALTDATNGAWALMLTWSPPSRLLYHTMSHGCKASELAVSPTR